MVAELLKLFAVAGWNLETDLAIEMFRIIRAQASCMLGVNGLPLTSTPSPCHRVFASRCIPKDRGYSTFQTTFPVTYIPPGAELPASSQPSTHTCTDPSTQPIAFADCDQLAVEHSNDATDGFSSEFLALVEGL